MTILLYLTTIFLALHVANSYVLLTANLDDFDAIVKQIAASPVGTRINEVFQRATSIFNQQVKGKPHKRSDPALDDGHSFEVWKPDQDSSSDDEHSDHRYDSYLKGDASMTRRTAEDRRQSVDNNGSHGAVMNVSHSATFNVTHV